MNKHIKVNQELVKLQKGMEENLSEIFFSFYCSFIHVSVHLKHFSKLQSETLHFSKEHLSFFAWYHDNECQIYS